MLKHRIIPILTFNGFALVKTKQFKNPRMVGNPVQAARVYNSRGVDELAFIDIFASRQNRSLNHRLVADIIKECYMPIAIGGAISNMEDISKLLKIGADKVIIKSAAIEDTDFIKEAVHAFGSQCITIAIDGFIKEDKMLIFRHDKEDLDLELFIQTMEECKVGEYILNSIEQDGMMNGFDTALIARFSDLTNKPIIVSGGGGEPVHYTDLFNKTNIEAVGSSSIFHFTQYTPNDIKQELFRDGKPVRL